MNRYNRWDKELPDRKPLETIQIGRDGLVVRKSYFWAKKLRKHNQAQIRSGRIPMAYHVGIKAIMSVLMLVRTTRCLGQKKRISRCRQ